MSDHQFFDLDGTLRGRVHHGRMVDGVWRLVFGDKQTLVIRPLQHDKVKVPNACPTGLEFVLARLTYYALACDEADEAQRAKAIPKLKELARIGTGGAVDDAKVDALFGILRDGLFDKEKRHIPARRAAWDHAQLEQVLELVALVTDPATVLPADLDNPAKRQDAVANLYMGALATMPSARAQAIRDRLFAEWHPAWALKFDTATRQLIQFVARFDGAATSSTCPVTDYEWHGLDAEESRWMAAHEEQVKEDAKREAKERQEEQDRLQLQHQHEQMMATYNHIAKRIGDQQSLSHKPKINEQVLYLILERLAKREGQEKPTATMFFRAFMLDKMSMKDMKAKGWKERTCRNRRQQAERVMKELFDLPEIVPLKVWRSTFDPRVFAEPEKQIEEARRRGRKAYLMEPRQDDDGDGREE